MTTPPEDPRVPPEAIDSAPVPDGPTDPPPTPSNPLISADPAPVSGWTAPARPTPGVPEVAPGLVYADVASRLMAFILDLLIVGLITSVVAAVAGLRPDFVSIDGLQTVSLGFDYSILSVAVGLTYFVASWSGGRRATLGQRLFRLQVGNAADGHPLTLEQAVRRWLGYGHFLVLFSFEAGIANVASLIQLVWVVALLVSTVSSPTSQGLHDRLANTAVVRPSSAGRGAAITCLVIVLVVIGLAIAAFAAFIGSDAGRELLERAMDRV